MSVVDLFRKRKIEREIDDELRFHLDMLIEDNVRAGMSPEEARRRALRRFGNVTMTREDARDARGPGLIDVVLRDLRMGVRALRRRPGFATAAILTLALGIGASTAMFSVVDAVLLEPLPYREPDRLVKLVEVHPTQPGGAVGVGNFLDWEQQVTSLGSMAAYFSWTLNLTGSGGEPERLRALIVTGGFFDVLGSPPLLGRTIDRGDDRDGHDTVVVLGERLWRRRFNADPGIAGKTIVIDDKSFTVAGVWPAAASFPDADIDLYAPAGFDARTRANRRGKFTWVIARLAPGVELDTARAEMDAVQAVLERDHPDTNAGWKIQVTPLVDSVVGGVRPTLLVLLGGALLLLLLSCANVAVLLLAHAAARRRELALRVALGASRGRLVTQLLAEGLLLALLGAAAGATLAWLCVGALAALAPATIPRLAGVGVDATALLFTVGVASAAVVLVGLAPALFAARTAPDEALRSEGRATTSRGAARQALVVAQVAVALVLLVGAGLLVKSFVRLVAVDPGFNSERLLATSVSLPVSRYKENHAQIAFFTDLVARAGALPGVQAAAAIQDLPFRRNIMGMHLVIEGRPAVPDVQAPTGGVRVVTPGYFAAMGVPLRAGRDLLAADDEAAPPVIVLNATMAHKYFPEEDPLGHRVKFGGDGAPWRTIVGVVADVKHMGLDAEEGAVFYQPLAQKPEFLRWMTLVVRTAGDPAASAATVRATIAAIDPDLPVYDVTTLRELIDRSVAGPRFAMTLIALFAAVALALAAVGVYGVLAFWVTQRTKEIGIHLALGARRRDVVLLVLVHGLRLAGAGVVLGLGAAVLLSGSLKKLLYDVPPTDALTFVSVSLGLLAVAALACFVPARRAARVDPLRALAD